MESYYYNPDGGKPKKKRQHSLLSVLVNAVMALCTFVCFVALVLMLVTSYFDPSQSWMFTVIGLITPAIYMFGVLLCLYWLIRWRIFYALVLMLPLLVALPSVSRYFKLETQKVYEQGSTRGVIKLMSYNICSFTHKSEALSMGDYLEAERADIICFQEYPDAGARGSNRAKFMDSYNTVVMDGQAIYSRYPIVGSSTNLISDKGDSGNAFWADLLIGNDTVRLFNIHLHSTTITSDDNAFISSMEFIGNDDSDDKIRNMIYRFKESSIGRAAQANAIAQSIAQSPHRVIVCGDFNDTPNSYAYRQIANTLQDSFALQGDGYSYTYRGFLNLLRIDYILVQRPTQVLSYQVNTDVELSDHHPVITNLKL